MASLSKPIKGTMKCPSCGALVKAPLEKLREHIDGHVTKAKVLEARLWAFIREESIRGLPNA